MELVTIVVMLALIEYFIFSLRVGMARGTYDIPAPRTSGHETFDRLYRVQMNTSEQLLLFIPAMFAFGFYVHSTAAAGLGVLFIAGRAVYARGYVADPAGRGVGFMMGMLANAILVIGAIIGAARQL